MKIETHEKLTQQSFCYQGLRILTGKSTLNEDSGAYEKYEYRYLGRWYIKSTFLRDS